MKTNFWKFAAFLGLGLAAMVACQKETKPTVEPIFPTEIYENYEVIAGEVQSFTITPNMDWEISVPTKDIQWFWLMKENDDQKYNKLSGVASDKPFEILVGVNETEEFSENRSVDVTLTMGGQSKVVAKLVRPAKSRVFKVYAATLDDYGFIPSEDSENIYAYTSEPVSSMTLAWPEDKTGFMMPVKIEANFEWQMTYPDWITYTDPNEDYGKVGIIQINLNGVPSKYPVNGATEKIVITAVDDPTFAQEIDITIPGCADRISFGLWNSIASPLTFNAAGQYNSLYAGYTDGPAGAFISATKNARVIAVEWNSSWEAYDTKEASWITISLGSWSEAEGADVIQERDVEISVSENTSDQERKAMLFFLPESVTVTDVVALFNDQGTEVLAEYKKYTMELTQAAKVAGASYITLQKTDEDLASVGGAFGVSTESWLPGMFGVSPESAYKLTYSKTWSRDEATLMFAYAYDSYEVINADGVRVTEENYWLQLMELGTSKTSAVVDMNADVSTEGFIKFLDADGNAIAVIWCVFDPSFTADGDSGSGSGSVEFIGEMAMYASMVGASLAEVTEGEYYEMYKEYGCPIYSLTYASYMAQTMPMSISTPQYSMAMVMPTNMSEFFWSEMTEGGATIYMQVPDSMPTATAAMMFYGMDYTPVLILICNWAPVQ